MHARTRGVPAQRTVDLAGVREDLPGVYRAALDPAEWEPVLASLSRRFGTGSAVLMTMDKLRGRAVTLELSGFADQSPGKARSGVQLSSFLAADDFIYQVTRNRPIGSTHLTSEIMTVEQLMASPIYANVLAPKGLRYLLGGVVENDEHFYSAVGFWHAEQSPHLGTRYREILATLLPHFRVAVKVGRRLRQAQANQWASLYSMQFSRHGIILLNQRKTVMFANKEAGRILRAKDGISASEGQLQFTDARAAECFREALEEGDRPDPGARGTERSFRVRRRSLHLPYDVLVIPRAGRPDYGRLPGGADYLVLLSDPVEVFSISRVTLVKHYGLTDAEARLCHALLRTGSLVKAALTLEITTNTARTHLKRIFAKLRVSSQMQLLQWLGSSIRAPLAEGLDAGIFGS